MKIRPTQIIGLVAIVVFGGILVTTLMKGKRDPDLLPSGVRLSELPTLSLPLVDATPPPAQPLEVGSQDAKDDLYCSGIVFAAQLESTETDVVAAQKRIDGYAALAEGGRAKLIAEGVVNESNAIVVGNAWSAKAEADFKAKAARIPLTDCLARPAAHKRASASTSPSNPAEPDFTALGSQAAKDDLYCAGVISSEFDAKKHQDPDIMEKQIGAMRALDAAGLAKLRTEGIATGSNGAQFSQAHVAKANADYAAKTLRIPLAACMTRAVAALPVPN